MGLNSISRPCLGTSPKRTTLDHEASVFETMKAPISASVFTHFIEVAFTSTPKEADGHCVGEATPGLLD